MSMALTTDPKNVETWQGELHNCPDCGAGVVHDGRPKWVDGGIFVDVECSECAFRGRETWSHEITVRTYSDEHEALEVLLAEIEAVLGDTETPETMVGLREAYERLVGLGEAFDRLEVP